MPRKELPPPLPPESRTVGQLIAESLRLYGARFWPSLALGIGPALVGAGIAELPRTLEWLLVPTVGTALWSAAYIGACRLALGTGSANTAVAFGAGCLAFAPLLVQRIAVVPGFDLLTLAFFAFVSLAVPAALKERLRFADAVRRGIRLARADYVHALGSLAALVIVIFLSGLVLVVLLHGFGDQAIRAAALISLLVLAPVFLLGAALLYVDQSARVVSSSTRPRRRRDADVHPALEPDGAGRADAEVEPRPPARGEP
ncbi:MAG TPA: hypothetical protein VE736_12420 [Gaiellaceae bacterium]|nr:hypothetical protein [Gaiellaceae bacterium]